MKELATSNNKLNALRASVLGANDGIVSTAGLVLGVAGATIDKEAVLLAGVAGLISGALSMAAGEYVSVSSQRDSRKAFLKRSKEAKLDSQASKPVAEGVQLAKAYISLGMSKDTALVAAKEVSKAGKTKEALGVDTESGKKEAEQIVNPWYSSASSAVAFVLGSSIPLVAIALSPADQAPIYTIAAVIISLILTGALSAAAGKANKVVAAARIVLWGVAAMGITYAIGMLIGASLL